MSADLTSPTPPEHDTQKFVCPGNYSHGLGPPEDNRHKKGARGRWTSGHLAVADRHNKKLVFPQNMDRGLKSWGTLYLSRTC